MQPLSCPALLYIFCKFGETGVKIICERFECIRIYYGLLAQWLYQWLHTALVIIGLLFAYDAGLKCRLCFIDYKMTKSVIDKMIGALFNS